MPIASTAVTPVALLQPRVTMVPWRLSTAKTSRSLPMAVASCSAKLVWILPSVNKDEPMMTRRAPASRSSTASFLLRIPPPTWQANRRDRPSTSKRLFPRPRAASRSITWTSGKREKRSTQGEKSSNSSAFFSPWISWTIFPSMRSIEGISMASAPECPRNASWLSVPRPIALQSEKGMQRGQRPQRLGGTLQ